MTEENEIIPVKNGGKPLTTYEAGQLIGKARAAMQGAPEEQENPDEEAPPEQELEENEEQEGSDTEDPVEPDETLEIKTVSDLAAAADIDPDEIAELEIAMPNGDPVQLKELQQGYLRQADHTRKSQELAEKRRDEEARAAEQQQAAQAQAVQLAQMLQQGKQLLMGEINSAEMQHLRVNNPAEFAARSISYQQRMQHVDQLFNTAADQYDKYQTTQAEQQRKKLQDTANAEREKLLLAIPDFQAVAPKISSFLTDRGFSAEELDQVVDSRLILLANDARQYQELKKAGAKTKKRVAKVPKPIKSTAKAPVSKTEVSRKEAIAKLKKSGSARDAGELLKLLRSK